MFKRFLYELKIIIFPAYVIRSRRKEMKNLLSQFANNPPNEELRKSSKGMSYLMQRERVQAIEGVREISARIACETSADFVHLPLAHLRLQKWRIILGV
jgi:hypothetical protein